MLFNEPAKIDKLTGSLTDVLWQTVGKANAQAQCHARLIRTMIAIAQLSRPCERAGKEGHRSPKQTAEKYATEIAA